MNPATLLSCVREGARSGTAAGSELGLKSSEAQSPRGSIALYRLPSERAAEVEEATVVAKSFGPSIAARSGHADRVARRCRVLPGGDSGRGHRRCHRVPPSGRPTSWMPKIRPNAALCGLGGEEERRVPPRLR